MEQSQEMSSQDKENLGGQVMESLGEPEDAAEAVTEPESDSHRESEELPDGVKQRLGRQEKRHKKQLRELQDQILQMQMQSKTPEYSAASPESPINPYTGQPIAPGSDEDKIHRAVQMALQAREQDEKRAKDMQSQAHVHKQYQALRDQLDDASSKYDDFDDVVRGDDVPFTSSMRDTALLLPNAADVLYKLGKNKSELNRISALHPLDQAKEMIKLAMSMAGSPKTNNVPKTLSQVKASPVSSNAQVNEATSVGEIRRRMKAGWK